jgi:hypothetical protein
MNSAPPAGFEPAHMAPEATALSPELRGLGVTKASRLELKLESYRWCSKLLVKYQDLVPHESSGAIFVRCLTIVAFKLPNPTNLVPNWSTKCARTDST